MQNRISDTYEIIGKIGAGNSGEIYKAYHKNLRKYVVLKKIRTEIKDIVNNRAEADVLKNLKHPCLPQVYDFLEADGNVYTVMDYISGNSFKQYLDAGTVFEEKVVVTWAKQICATLSYLHKQKPPIIHSDLKPGNVMLMPDGNICLIDFNISSSLDGDSAWVTGYTNGYAAPEQIYALQYNQNELDQSRWKTIDARADIYSFGATIYHLLTGSKVHLDENGDAEDIRDTGVKINDVFAGIIMKCLEKDPERRYQTADELLADLQSIQKKDRRYNNLLKKQKGIYIAVIVCMFLSAFIAVRGYLRIDVERQKEYEQMVRLETECISKGEYDNFEVYFEKAVNIDSQRLEAYYQKALALNQQKKYGENIEFINSRILGNSEIQASEQSMNNVYYLLGNSYEKLEDFEHAAQAYEKAIEIKPDSTNYYRDYAIALAKSGKMEEAKAALKEAKAQNLSSVETDYVEGEILYSSESYSEAKDIFLSCIENAQDDYLKMRAYIMAGKCIDETSQGTEKESDKIELFEEARQKLPKENNIAVLEQLAQAYCDMAQETGETQYYQKAVQVFEQIQEQGMGSYDTDYNLAIIYQSIQEYSKAYEVLNNMLEKYGENYRTYKRLAFWEVAKQSLVANDQKSYLQFQDYYLKAKELYEEQLENNANDVEMDRLSELYQDAVNNGWIKQQ